MEFLPPKAERYGAIVARRLENRALRAYDRFKLEQEQREADKRRILDETQKDETSSRSEEERISGLYLNVDWRDEDEDASSSITGMSKEAPVGVCGKLCDKLFTLSTRPYLLKWWEFLAILIFLNTSIPYNANSVELSIRWGAIMVLLVSIATQILISSPLFMAYMFLASYSRRSYIRFWDCVPLMKGLGYSILLTCVIAEIFNIAFTGLTVLYLSLLVIEGHVPWKQCNFPYAHPDCMPFEKSAKDAPFRHTAVCCSRNECGHLEQARNAAKFASLDYYISYILRRGYGEKALYDGILPSWAVIVAILWIILCFFMTIGLRKFRRFFATLDVTLLCSLIPAIVTTIILSPNYGLMREMQTDYRNLFNGSMWLDFIVYHLYRELPSDVVALGALSIPAVSTTSDTVIIYTLKIFWGAMNVVWTCITAKFVQENYKIKDDFCIMIRGDYLIFVLMPDFTAWYPLGYFMIIMFLIVIGFWNFSVSVYVLNNAIEAVLDEFPMIYKFRLVLALATSVVIGSLNIIILRPEFMETFQYYMDNVFPVIVSFQLLTAWIGIFLYSIRKIVDDYHFTFATKLSLYWRFGLKLGLLTFWILVILLYYQNVLRKLNNPVCIAVLWPIPAGIIIMVLRYYMRINKSLLDPHPLWGPPTKKRKQARAIFDPAHDMRYRSTVQKCKHNCLIRSAAVKRERKHWRAKLELIFSLLEDTNYTYEDDAWVLQAANSSISNQSF